MGMTHSDYERVCAECDHCRTGNIYHRVSDLHRIAPIDGMNVKCRSCQKEFWIFGDTINPAYQMLLVDCAQLREHRHYMYCILNICQSYEMFFSEYFRSLLYRAFAKSHDLDALNSLLDDLAERTSKYNFAQLRCNFLRRAALEWIPSSPREAGLLIMCLCGDHRDATKVDLDSCKNEELKRSLEKMKSTGINQIRNSVVHQRAYRPDIEDVNKHLDEAMDLLFVLPQQLGMKGDDVNLYRVGV